MKLVRIVGVLAFVIFAISGLAEAAGGGHHYGKIGFAKVPLMLLALAVGYWVLTLSEKQKKPMDLVGRLIGGLIVLVALLGLICSAAFGYRKYSKYKCGKWSKSECSYHQAKGDLAPSDKK